MDKDNGFYSTLTFIIYTDSVGFIVSLVSFVNNMKHLYLNFIPTEIGEIADSMVVITSNLMI